MGYSAQHERQMLLLCFAAQRGSCCKVDLLVRAMRRALGCSKHGLGVEGEKRWVDNCAMYQGLHWLRPSSILSVDDSMLHLLTASKCLYL